MSAKRRAAGPVRQLSLQQSTRRQLRKQASEDNPRLRRQGSEEKALWGDHGLRVLASSIVAPGPGDTPDPRPVRRDPQPAVVRPRPVRIAWSERRQASCEGDVTVGVVVQRCKGLPRPVSSKPARQPQPESILYSRQQLAERLRIAWKDRQERPNLDIFLAHNSLDLPEEDGVISVRDITTEIEKTAVRSSDEGRFENLSTPLSDIGNTTELIVSNAFQKKRSDASEKSQNHLSTINTFTTATFPLSTFRDSLDSDKEVVETRPRPKLTPSITISFDHGSDIDHVNNENDAEEDNSLSLIQESIDTNLLKPDCFTYSELTKPELSFQKVLGEKKIEAPVIKEPDKLKETLTASARRAYFKNSNNISAMSGSMSVPSTPPATPTPVKPILKKPNSQPLTRMMSAPASGRSTSNITRNITVKDITTVRPEQKLEEVNSLDCDEDDLTIVHRERNIKSAPARRRFKARRKGAKSHEDDSSEDEEGFVEPPPVSKPRNRKRFIEKGADIVTMVSLLSPNESEAEETPDPVIQLPPEAQWSRTSGGPQVTAITTHPTSQPLKPERRETEVKPLQSVNSFTAAASIVCLRKVPTKTVSFQQQGAAARSYTASMSYPSRRGAGTPIILPPEPAAPAPDPPTPPPILPPAPVPAPTRRRLVKAKSTSALGCDSESLPEAEVEAEVEPKLPRAPIPRTTVEVEEPELDPSTEPPFRTDKERECWQMFRKMADKGVAVSYDTVLRGMLTPTEYRMHKKSLSSAS